MSSSNMLKKHNLILFLWYTWVKTAFKDGSEHHFPMGYFSIQQQDELVLGINQVRVVNENYVVSENHVANEEGNWKTSDNLSFIKLKH